MDDEKNFFPFLRYGDTKLLATMFMSSLAPLLDKDKVVINMLCPGMVNTSMSDVLPIHLRLVVNVVKAIMARPVEQGVWLILNAAVVAGHESHGEFLEDKDIALPSEYIQSSAGKEVQKKMWTETFDVMSQITSLPPELKLAA